MKKFNNSELYQLLHIIHHNGNIRRVVRKDITFIQVIDNIKDLTLKEILHYEDAKLSLTDEGLKIFNELAQKYKNTDKDKWIEKEEKSRLKNKLELDFVYLPDQNKLFF
ncbi:hypothetical protein [Elizabethkingia miricola]|uniref:hypothetical protein n=1 Tax=Elizabethkingia miricola TaxID=172045 RepID=UPI000B350F09|nr:hypothetical protein [Elizabethkingia miricola]NHQ68846.1 hypothetical protein [Elizabethkingia miricola]NHQ72760.1 hypothetical protein [Elizabethkingia miricola]NHQ79890.1 hypothetical protein [Elizabethkingia miricola]PSL89519.1 hypothetical protein C7V10_04210 [Elizabethkingia miricola]QHQ87507.1 hypothetical protein FE632_12245 [Elizabethkingia miricola]